MEIIPYVYMYILTLTSKLNGTPTPSFLTDDFEPRAENSSFGSHGVACLIIHNKAFGGIFYYPILHHIKIIRAGN